MSKKEGESRRSTAAQYFHEDEDESGTEQRV